MRTVCSAVCCLAGLHGLLTDSLIELAALAAPRCFRCRCHHLRHRLHLWQCFGFRHRRRSCCGFRHRRRTSCCVFRHSPSRRRTTWWRLRRCHRLCDQPEVAIGELDYLVAVVSPEPDPELARPRPHSAQRTMQDCWRQEVVVSLVDQQHDHS